jgi:hypothetical protein
MMLDKRGEHHYKVKERQKRTLPASHESQILFSKIYWVYAYFTEEYYGQIAYR